MVPLMRMGLLGFTPQENDRLCSLLKAHSLVFEWERWPFMEADALWVNGAHAQRTKDNLVRIPSGDPTRPATLLDLRGMDRPTAFALPLSSAGLKPPHVFDPASPASVSSILRRFEGWLRPLAAQLTLCQCLSDRRHTLDSSVYHLTLEGRLLAILCARGDVGLAPGLAPAEVSAAEWGARPQSASIIPEHFQRTTIPQMMWQFALRTREDLLPKRYLQGLVYFRRVPPVPPPALKEAHRMILSLLAAEPATFAQLRQQTGLGEPAMAHALAALYLAGGITTDPRKAASRRVRGTVQAQAPQSRATLFGASSSIDSSLQSHFGDAAAQPHSTLPASLEQRRLG